MSQLVREKSTTMTATTIQLCGQHELYNDDSDDDHHHYDYATDDVVRFYLLQIVSIRKVCSCCQCCCYCFNSLSNHATPSFFVVCVRMYDVCSCNITTLEKVKFYFWKFFQLQLDHIVMFDELFKCYNLLFDGLFVISL